MRTTTVVDRLARDAAARRVPPPVVARARAVTQRWVAANHVVNERRTTAYFWAVVRKTAFHEPKSGDELRTRFLVASMVADLRDGGADESRIRAEVGRL